ncbi:MAG: agmatinase [Candidatus Hodarchaeales archaeon]|jgi:agmatinase
MGLNHTFGGFDQWRDSYFSTIIGAPFELKASYRPGASQAPDAIRQASENIETYSIQEGIDLADLGILDIGNVSAGERNVRTYLSKLKGSVLKALDNSTIPVILGGEHTVTLSSLEPFSNSLFIVFDAHADLRNEWLGSRYSHACVFRRFLEELSSDQLIQLGVRAVCKEEIKFAEKESIRQISPREFSKTGSKGIIQELLSYASNFDSIYISVDLDGFDPAFAPGVGTPEANGLTPREFFDVIYGLDAPIKGLDIVEMVPAVEPSGITAILAARIVFEVLAHEAKRNQLIDY